VIPGKSYPVSFITEQGIPTKYGSQRQKTGLTAIEAMRSYLVKHKSYDQELKGSYMLV
jgi:S-sulfosulfanyl-L-cysteine sulfohydrolase